MTCANPHAQENPERNDPHCDETFVESSHVYATDAAFEEEYTEEDVVVYRGFSSERGSDGSVCVRTCVCLL